MTLKQITVDVILKMYRSLVTALIADVIHTFQSVIVATMKQCVP